MCSGAAAHAPPSPPSPPPALCCAVQEYGAGRYQAALDLFQLALELPGSGYMRMSGSPKEYSCASEGEENAALYNMACCWVALGQKQASSLDSAALMVPPPHARPAEAAEAVVSHLLPTVAYTLSPTNFTN